MTNPLSPDPVTDAGSDTFARYRFQAEVALPYCLRCAVDDDILAVTLEHHEDIALSTPSGYRFIQVKTRNPELPQWRLSLLLDPGGALRSLHRTYTSLGNRPGYTLELLIEGAPKRLDPIHHLRPNHPRNHPDLVTPVARALHITDVDALSFLLRVTLLGSPTHRSAIGDTNLRLIQEQVPGITLDDAKAIHQRLIVVIEAAMMGQPLGPAWPVHVLDPSTCPAPTKVRLDAKTLSRERIRATIAATTVPSRTSLKRMTDQQAGSFSVLEQKLLAGGATTDLVDTARTLRANAQIHLLEARARQLFPSDAALEDLEVRLYAHAVALKEMHRSTSAPAIPTFRELLLELTQHARAVDRSNIMNSDPMLLMGQVCELADECRVDFGIAP